MGICYPDSTNWSCYGTPEEVGALDPEPKAFAEAMAWSTLAALSGYRISTCPVTIRPCKEGCGNPGSYLVAPVVLGGGGYIPGPFTPYLLGGSWYNVSCGCSTDCSCTGLSQIKLPAGTGGVAEVRQNGAVVSPSAYRVDGNRWLVRTDGDQWPLCQDMSVDADDPAAFTVTFWPGYPPNSLINRAAGMLAAEFLKACTGDDCALPTNVTQVTRAGITYDVKSDMFIDGDTGIPAVNTVIRLYNPNGLKSRPKIFSPDKRSPRMTTSRAI